MNRAYSLLTVRSVDASARTFAGIATTPTTDRMGDVVEPTGGKFALPLPLLLHHDSRLPVGNVESADVRSSGITVRCRVARIDEPGTLKDRVDEAWHSVTAGVIRGLSIGFRIVGDGIEPMRSGGLRYTSWELLELSLVAVPANSDCTIQTVKHFASAARSRRSGGGIKLIQPLHEEHPGAVKLIGEGTRR